MPKPLLPAAEPGFPAIEDAACAALLLRIVNNIIAHPSEAKFRSLNMSGAAFSKLRDSSSTQDFLSRLGFVSREGRLVLDDGMDLKLLEAGRDALRISQSDGVVPAGEDLFPEFLRIVQPRDLMYRRELNVPGFGACTLKHAEWTKSGACMKCKQPSLVADDYCVCWQCKAYYCLQCTIGGAAIDPSRFGHSLQQQGFWARCLECNAEFGAASLPFVFCGVLSAQSGGFDLQRNAADLLLSDAARCMQRGNVEESAGRKHEAIQLYTRCINTVNYMRGRTPEHFDARGARLLQQAVMHRAACEGDAELAQRIRAALGDGGPRSDDEARFVDLFLTPDVLHTLVPASVIADLELAQDSRLRPSDPTNSQHMRFPYPESHFDSNGGLRRGLLVNRQAGGEDCLNCMMHFVREFRTATGARAYYDAESTLALELHNVIPFTSPPSGHREIALPGPLPAGCTARISVFSALVRARPLANASLVFVCGRFFTKIYVSYVASSDSFADEQTQKQAAEQAVLGLTIRMGRWVAERCLALQ